MFYLKLIFLKISQPHSGKFPHIDRSIPVGFLDGAISSIGSSLEQSVTTYANGQIDGAIGGTMGYLFGQDQEMGGQVLDGLAGALADKFGPGPQLDTLLSDVIQQQKAIAAIGNQLQAVSAAIARITGEIANIQALLQEIRQEQLYQAWASRNDFIKGYVNTIDTTYRQYADYMKHALKTHTKSITKLADDIINPGTGVGNAANGISTYLLSGGNQDKGALQLWSEMVAPLVTARKLDYREAVAEYMDYYSKLAYSQLQATNLLIEAYHFRAESDEAQSLWEAYKALLLRQEDQFIRFLVPLVYAAIPGGRFFDELMNPPRWYGNFTFFDAAMQLHPGGQTIEGDADRGSGFYQPSSVFLQAEKLLANLYVTDPEQRRIVVHLVYMDGEDGAISNRINGVQLTLDPGPIAAQHKAQLGPFDLSSDLRNEDSVPDQNMCWSGYTGNSFYVNRLVFTIGADGIPLGDGSYGVTDLNAALPPIDSYGGKVPFQEAKVLRYPLRVSTATPFDFMNFGGYMYSLRYPTCEAFHGIS